MAAESARRGQVLLPAAAYVVLYVALAWLSHARPVLKPEIAPWNPQTGLTIAFLLLYGPRLWPIATIAALISDVLVSSTGVAFPLSITACLWIGVIYGALAAILRRLDLTGPLLSARAAGRVAVAAVVAASAVAIGYVGLFVAAGEVSTADALRGAARYGLADVNGILMLTPLLVLAGDWRGSLGVLRNHWREATLQGALVLVTLIMVFFLPAADQLRFFYLLFVPVIWIALRWRITGALFAVLAIQVGLIVAAWAEIHTPRFLDLQVLLLTLSLTALLLGAVVAERAAILHRLREQDAELARATRFAVAGELTSALAHELNQPITALVSYLRASEILASRHENVDPQLRATLQKSVNEAMRASDVLKKLRDFYRSGAMKRERIDFAALSTRVAAGFQESLRLASATLVSTIDNTVPPVEGDATQLEIVLHNLIANAIDAVSRAPASQRRIELHATRSKDELILRVEDSGPGIPAELSREIFEPFVTTRSGGMGLGLAISRTLAQARGGDLSFGRSSTLGGACFKLRLPIEAPAFSAAEREATTRDRAHRIPGR
jgi:two-component system, LuxR family, sensor kinase FixL